MHQSKTIEKRRKRERESESERERERERERVRERERESESERECVRENGEGDNNYEQRASQCSSIVCKWK